MNITNVTLIDLWPGDVIIAREPGALVGRPHRFVNTEETDEGDVRVFLASLDGESHFSVMAPGNWSTVVERVV